MCTFTQWKRRAVAFARLPTSDWKCLALAQHHGLATRLLDWSWNPLVALFFAVAEYEDNDGAIYARPSGRLVAEESFSDLHEVSTYEPPPFDRRIAAQQGVFTYHPNPLKALEPSVAYSGQHNAFNTDLVEIIVPKKIKSALIRDLHVLGINRATLFPDLEGLSWDLNRTSRPQIWRDAENPMN